ncbi:MAG: hypothetical protein ACYTGL_08075 [Planctomycetota bacterium]|jgi:hypothetical protein
MLHHFGIFLQIAGMTGLLLTIPYQLMFGFQLTIMPICTVAAIIVFYTGTQLRERGR